MTAQVVPFELHRFKTADYGTGSYLLPRKLPWASLERNGQQVVFCFPATAEVMAAVGDDTSNKSIPCRDYFHGLRRAKATIQANIDHGRAKRTPPR
jgi:hypothetical protein